MKTLKNHNEYYTPIQMKFPVDLEKIIEISDPIYTFNEIMEKIDLYKYFAGKGSHYSAYVSSGTTGHIGGDMLVRKTLTEINDMWK